MANTEISQPPGGERAVEAQLADEEAKPAPRGQVIRLDDARRRRIASGRRSWRPKGW